MSPVQKMQVTCVEISASHRGDKSLVYTHFTEKFCHSRELGVHWKLMLLLQREDFGLQSCQTCTFDQHSTPLKI